MAVYKSLKFWDIEIGDELLITRAGGNIYHGSVVKKTDRLVGIKDYTTDARSYFYREDSQITAHLVYRPQRFITNEWTTIETSDGEVWTHYKGLWLSKTNGGKNFMGMMEFFTHMDGKEWRYV